MGQALRAAKHRVEFLAAIARSPRSVGAIAPSGPFLARKMARQVNPHHPGYVIEIGAGSGPVTRALLASGVRPDRLLVVERDRRLCRLLQRKFPEVRVVRADAADLAALLDEHRVNRVNAIVSSLPLLAMPKPVQETIVKAMFDVLPPDAPLIQFTYGARSSITSRQCKHHGAMAHKIGRVWTNFPPAAVWVYRRGGGAEN